MPPKIWMPRSAAVTALREDGWLTGGDDEPVLTAAGAARRAAIERHTDRLAVPAFEPIGQQGCERMIQLAPPIVVALDRAGLGRGPAS